MANNGLFTASNNGLQASAHYCHARLNRCSTLQLDQALPSHHTADHIQERADERHGDVGEQPLAIEGAELLAVNCQETTGPDGVEQGGKSFVAGVEEQQGACGRSGVSEGGVDEGKVSEGCD